MLIAVKAMNLCGTMQMSSCPTFTCQHMNVRQVLPLTSSKLATDCMFLYMLDEMFHVFKQLKEVDFNVQCIIAWEILHITQPHCTEQCRGEKAKG